MGGIPLANEIKGIPKEHPAFVIALSSNLPHNFQKKDSDQKWLLVSEPGMHWHKYGKE